MGQRSSGIKFGSQLCKAIGIDSTRVEWLTLQLKPGCAPRSTVSLYVKEEEESEIVKLIERSEWITPDEIDEANGNTRED